MFERQLNSAFEATENPWRHRGYVCAKDGRRLGELFETLNFFFGTHSTPARALEIWSEKSGVTIARRSAKVLRFTPAHPANC